MTTNTFDDVVSGIKSLCDKAVREVERHRDVDAMKNGAKAELSALLITVKDEERKIEALRKEAGELTTRIGSANTSAAQITAAANRSAETIRVNARSEADKILAAAKEKAAKALAHLDN